MASQYMYIWLHVSFPNNSCPINQFMHAAFFRNMVNPEITCAIRHRLNFALFVVVLFVFCLFFFCLLLFLLQRNNIKISISEITNSVLYFISNNVTLISWVRWMFYNQNEHLAFPVFFVWYIKFIPQIRNI